MRIDDKLLHTIQLAMVLIVAVVLILFAHEWVAPDVVFTSLVAGVGGLVGSRIASNGYMAPAGSPAGATITVTPSPPAVTVNPTPQGVSNANINP